ncbi:MULTISPECIES: bifunctional 2-polyprenyl-6-hydroxyphenol methylase/3-demethylubiquinol 3-O-methyltransferase UbiG [unclassified Streptomyces]|uniref:bifunctional 2-polyprenyl-6-hydroxyphenol methylase/3-demethylubiquinol 3-O-methyltransferase UbiG n=1 Tax=unclassified Streptomyces TaxID=2593676 RepID=UPI000DC7BCC2|nr:MULTISPECIES: bifunctional 2-polyprenyl-6-hydroxyphenol methylase/3-demethylubiquinol 3-O-methyltransferase UbiG [unclassified Streptomyces]AWZ06492.1 3-demethylubiquinone-9 3-O-methyltransferase [Streptomyces sp. ICC4]AWZ14122.1 3-demethylubiquinone-9 3-O-methyltransferase [Streptomyces sp. ICC1]
MSGLRTDFISDYDGLADQWWDPRGPLAPLGWIARARAEHIPPAAREQARLLDVGCGGGLFGPHVAGKGYRLVGVDLSAKSLEEALRHGFDEVVRTDISELPFPDESFDVVTAGQCLEHVPDPYGVVAELCRVLRPGGTLVVDTIADTRIARLVSITLAENLPLPGRPARGTHDHRLFVNRERLVKAARAHGVELELHGLRPSFRDGIGYLARRREGVRMVPVRSTGVLFLGAGTKAGPTW